MWEMMKRKRNGDTKDDEKKIIQLQRATMWNSKCDEDISKNNVK